MTDPTPRTDYRFVSVSKMGTEMVHKCRGLHAANIVERNLLQNGHSVTLTHINGYDVRDIGRASDVH